MTVAWSVGYSYGPGTDCEMCGFTPDEVFAERSQAGTYTIIIRGGCTGGGSSFGISAEEALVFIQEWRDDMTHIPDLVEFLGKISQRIREDMED